MGNNLSKNNLSKNEIERLEQILRKNNCIQKILEQAPLLQMSNWYLAAGCISQTVWNVLHGFEPTYGIRDYDLVYYDASDTSYEGEDRYIRKSKEIFKDIPRLIDLKNEARVHLWFEGHYGFKIEPYKSIEEAISSWSPMVACVGARYINGKFDVYAPYGLEDLFNMVVKPNKVLFTKEMHQNKADGWRKIWPKIKIIPWA